MTRLFGLRILMVAGLVAGLAGVSQAALVSGLNNTGAGLLNPGVADSNYVLVADSNNPLLSSAPMYTTHSTGFPTTGPWLANTTTSQWIMPTSGTATTHAPGLYTIETTFNVDPTTDLSSIVINGRWASDNGAQMMLNTVASPMSTTPVPPISDPMAYSFWTPFTLNSGFVVGLNTLKFKVTNLAGTTNNPTGLRVEFNAPQAVAVPEPATLVSAGVALAGLALARRFRARRAVA